jgi:hypothetical protein
MTIQLSKLRERLIDANGIPMGGAKLYTYSNGTTTPLTTYSTPAFTPGTELPNPVVADSGGLLPQIFFPTATYTLTLKTSTNAAVWSQDNVAVDNGAAITFDDTTIKTVSGTTGVYALPNVQSGTSYSIVTGDRGKLVTFTNSSAITVTQPAAGASFPNGWFVDLENRGVGVVTFSSSSNIDGVGSITLLQGQGVRVFSDGATYYTQKGKPQSLYTEPGGTLTIATGAVTAGAFSQYLVDTEAAAASDDLDTISGGITGKTLFLRTVADARDVVVKHNTGNIYNPSLQDITLGKTQDIIELRYDDSLTKWVVVSYQNAQTTFSQLSSRVPDAMCSFNGTGTPAYIQNIGFTGAPTDNGVGDYTAASSYITTSSIISITMNVGTTGIMYGLQDQSAGSVRTYTKTDDGAAVDPPLVSICVWNVK